MMKTLERSILTLWRARIAFELERAADFPSRSLSSVLRGQRAIGRSSRSLRTEAPSQNVRLTHSHLRPASEAHARTCSVRVSGSRRSSARMTSYPSPRKTDAIDTEILGNLEIQPPPRRKRKTGDS